MVISSSLPILSSRRIVLAALFLERCAVSSMPGSPREDRIWSSQGVSEGDDYCGRGWFEFATPLKGEDRLFIHCGDEPGVTIERQT